MSENCSGGTYAMAEAVSVSIWRSGILSGIWTEEQIPEPPTVEDWVELGMIKRCSVHPDHYIKGKAPAGAFTKKYLEKPPD